MRVLYFRYSKSDPPTLPLPTTKPCALSLSQRVDALAVAVGNPPVRAITTWMNGMGWFVCLLAGGTGSGHQHPRGAIGRAKTNLPTAICLDGNN